MRSGSESASSSAPFTDVFGSVDHAFTVVRSSSYFFCCSAVRAGGGAGFLPSAGCGKGPMADMVLKMWSDGEERRKMKVLYNRKGAR